MRGGSGRLPDSTGDPLGPLPGQCPSGQEQGTEAEGRQETVWHRVRAGLGLRASWVTSVLSSV